MFAIIVDDKTKVCNVGLGADTEYYKSIGMVEMDVEQAYNGQWYVKGYTPAKPQNVINVERIAELKQYLANTDYVVTKIAEGVATKEEYTDVLAKRVEARAEINELEQ